MRKLSTKIFACLLSLILLATCTVGCSKKQEKVTIDMVIAPGSSSWISTYAIRNGLLTSDLVDLQIELSPNFGTLMMSGEYTMGAMQGAGFAVEEESTPGTYKALCTFISGEGLLEARGVCLVCTRKDSGINSVEDIFDKTIGVSDLQGSTASIFLGLLKKQYGVDETDLNLINKSSTVLLEMLLAGEIDVALLDGSNNVAPTAYYNDELQVIWNLDEAFYEEYGVYHAPTLLLVKSDFYEENEEAVIAARELLLASEKYAEDNLETLAEEFAKEYAQGNGAEFIITMTNYHSHASYDALTGKTLEGAMAIIQLAVDRGIVSELPDPDEIFIKLD